MGLYQERDRKGGQYPLFIWSAQMDKELEKHSALPHSVSVSKEQMQRHEAAIRKDVQNIEDKIDEFKEDTKTRFDRIETKLDSM